MRSKKKLDSFVDNLEVDFFFGLRMATIDIYIYIDMTFYDFVTIRYGGWVV